MTAPLDRVYNIAQVRQLDQLAIAAGIPAHVLMSRAGEAAFALLKQQFPQARSLCVLCGAGNNAGDGYVVARLALQAGWQVQAVAVGEASRLHGAAQRAYATFVQAGGRPLPFAGEALPVADVYVDALLGIGLVRPVEGRFAMAIATLNAQAAPVLALDVPSGLHADTGQPQGAAVRAHVTITFIGMKAGLLTGQARAYVGTLHCHTLGVPDSVYAQVPTTMHIIGEAIFRQHLPPRQRTAHKGQHGHTLVVGGAVGMAGAVQLAGEAALRAGSGLASVATHPAHAACLHLARPELMVHGVADIAALRPLLRRADVIAVGCGLGQDTWAQQLWQSVLLAPQPKVLDADALNLLAKAPQRRDDWVLTPHPGEAARLLGCSTAQVEGDRVSAVRRLQAEYGGVVVLKGAGTLVAAADGVAFCTAGNPGMASAGMGDALTGVIAALLAQGLPLWVAAQVGVEAHARAGDWAAREGERGMLASDLIAALRRVLNLEVEHG